jgi:hypothetical protein
MARLRDRAIAPRSLGIAQPCAMTGIEPPVEELLDEQIAYLVMQRDGIGPADD